MGSGGVPNRTIEISYERNLKPIGKPNTRVDRYSKKDGKKLQSRWYDEKGRAKRNRDYTSSNGKEKIPHDHSWNWNNGNGVRGKEHLTPDYDSYY